VKKTATQQSAADQQDRGQSNLPNNGQRKESFPAVVTRDCFGAFLQLFIKCKPRDLDNRRQAKGNRSDHRDSQVEQENGQVQLEVRNASHEPVKEGISDQRTPRGETKTKTTPDHTQHEPFGEQLSDESALARSNAAPDSKFFFPSNCY
jgi:hypothetical protein